MLNPANTMTLSNILISVSSCLLITCIWLAINLKISRNLTMSLYKKYEPVDIYLGSGGKVRLSFIILKRDETHQFSESLTLIMNFIRVALDATHTEEGKFKKVALDDLLRQRGIHDMRIISYDKNTP